jgi:hypothetical protein
MPVNYNTELRISYLRAAQASVQEDDERLQAYRDFYNGEQGGLLTTRQTEYLNSGYFESFANFCRRCVHIVADRLRINTDGLAPADEASQSYADAARLWWSDDTDSDEGGDLDASALQPDIYTAACRDGSAAVIVGWDDRLGRPTFTPNLLYDSDTGLVRFHYDSDGTMLFASKRWAVWNPLDPSANGTSRLTIYTPGYIERYVSGRDSWQLIDPAVLGLPNPQPWTTTGAFGGDPLGIPVIPFDNPGGSELADVLGIQQMLNHNLSCFDRAVDFHAFPILYFPQLDIARAEDGSKTMPTYGPQTVIELPPEGGSVGRIEPADLTKMFNSGVMSWVQVLAQVKGWPMWVFDHSQQPPSGVALQQMERQLVEQIRQKQVAFTGAWRRAFNMGRKLHKLKTGQDLPGQIAFTWADAGSVDEQAKYQSLQLKFTGGQIPIIQRWRELGYSADQIEQMLQDKAREDDLGLADVTTGIAQ